MKPGPKQATEALTGTTAAGTAAAPYDMYADWLITNGLWIMSYADWLKVLGGLYCAILTLKMLGVFKLANWVWGKAQTGR